MMGEQTRQLCGAGGEVGERPRLLCRWVKNHSPHLSPTSLQSPCVSGSGQGWPEQRILSLYSLYPPTCLPALSSSFCAPKLGMSLPFLFLYSEARFSEADVGVLVASSFRACMSSATVLNFVRRFAKRSDSHCYFTSTIFHLLSPPGCLLAFAPPLPSVGNALPSLSPLILEAQV